MTSINTNPLTLNNDDYFQFPGGITVQDEIIPNNTFVFTDTESNEQVSMSIKDGNLDVTFSDSLEVTEAARVFFDAVMFNLPGWLESAGYVHKDSI